MLLAATAIAAPTGLLAQVLAPTATQTPAEPGVPTAQELSRISPSGGYLAARHAAARRDWAAASAYYRNALKSAPRNPELLSRAFLAVLFDGDIDEATRLADRILQLDRNDRTARLVLGVRALKQKQYVVARQHLALSVGGPITDLAAALLSAWTYANPTEQATAVSTIDKLSGADWYAIFKDLHAGMILDLVGNKKEAGRRLEKAYKADSSALRVVEAYGRWASRNAPKGEATKIYESFDKVLARHPLIVSAIDQLKTTTPVPAATTPAGSPLPVLTMLRTGASGDAVKRVQASLGINVDGVFGPPTARAVKEFQRKNGLRADGVVGPLTYAKLKIEQAPAAPAAPVVSAAPKSGSDELPPLVDSPQAGAAEVLYGIGASLGRRGGDDLGLVYLQLALYLMPQHGLTLLSLADIYEGQKNHALAIKIYERVPKDSPLRRNADIQIAVNLDAMEKADEAKQRLEKLIAERPKDLDAIMALGTIQRVRKEFDGCADTYGKGIATLSKSEKSNWVIYYYRGICYERGKKWDKAEVDLKKSLELEPDQPHVLNYLGYSWVDQGVHLEEGMRMIKLAVEKKPDDGYIVDSLGWAFYRIGNFEEATKHLERAVELKPDDPTINDHLGDAYWKIGRQLEARFQWMHARDLKPEPEELTKIDEKLKHGMRDEPTPSADAEKKKRDGGG